MSIEKRLSSLGLVTVLLLTLLMLSSFGFASSDSEMPQLEWSKIYPKDPPRNSTVPGARYRDVGNSLIQTSDGGYAIACGTWSSYRMGRGTATESYGGYIMKIDSMGEQVWKSGLPSPPKLSNSIIQTEESGFLASYDSPMWGVRKFDSEGQVEWSKRFEPDLLMIQSDDEGYILAGVSSYHSGNETPGTWIIKIDENGNMLWNKTLNAYSPSDVNTRDIVGISGGGYAVMGTWSSSSIRQASTTNLWLVKVDSNGDFRLNKTYNILETPNSPNPAEMSVTRDGGFIISGQLLLHGEGTDYYSPWLAKINPDGSLEWSRKYASGYEDSSYFASAVETGDGGIFAVGVSGSNPYSNAEMSPLLIKTDQFGNVLWKLTGYAGFWDTGVAYSGIVTDDGSYVVTGSVNDDVWLAKFAPESNIPPDDGSPDTQSPQFSTTLILAVVIIVGAVAVGLSVYVWKRNISRKRK